jgi:two-component system sensor histidine kinase KdpD
VSDTQYVVTFAVMLLVGLVVGTLTARLRTQGEAARHREWRTALLYDVTRDLAGAEDEQAMLRLIVPRIGPAVDGSADVFLPDGDGEYRAWSPDGGAPLQDPTVRGIVAWVMANRLPAGLGTGTFAGRPETYLPLATPSRAFGVLRLHAADADRLAAPEQAHLLQALTGQLAAAMERARLVGESRRARELEEVDRLKSEFVAVASRELQAPLASLARQLDALKDADAAAREPALATAAEDLQRVRRLVDDLLDLSRLEAGRLQLELRPRAPGDLVDAALAALGPAATVRDDAVTVDVAGDLPLVNADERRISAVLVGLLDNALRFAGSAGHIVVSADRVGPYVQFSVADDGPGVPLEEQARIFDTFARVGPADRPRGTGLGLAVAREIVHRHRGAMWVDSGPGPGSVFSFTLPVATPVHATD